MAGNQHVRQWSDEMLSELRGFVIDGLTNEQIAGKMSVTKDAVAHTCRRYDIRRKRTPNLLAAPDDFRAKAAGHTVNSASEAWHVGHGVIKRWFHDAGITPRIGRARPFGGTPWGRVQTATIDDSEAARAQRTLQRFGPVFRVSTLKPSDKTGDWMIWGKRRTVDELIEMAEQKAAA